MIPADFEKLTRVHPGMLSESEQWRWEYISYELMKKLDRVIACVGGGILPVITSSYRTSEENRRVGGATNSLHLQGKAVDIAWYGADMTKVVQCFKDVGFDQLYYDPTGNFVHAGIGGTLIPRFAHISVTKEEFDTLINFIKKPFVFFPLLLVGLILTYKT